MTDKNRVQGVALTRCANPLAGIRAFYFLLFSLVFLVLAQVANAQSYRFDAVRIEGNQRIEAQTILNYAGIARGETVSAAQMNAAYQRIQGSGLFEEVSVDPRGNTLVISVKEYPTINRISFEGNRRLKDDALGEMVQSKSRRVFNPTQAESDAARIAEAYSQQGRLAAKVTPRIIRRSDNRVDLVFEIFEGGLVEIERIGFVGNRAYSDYRLRRVLETKQAGILRALIKRDTLVEDRIEFDKQVLNDFYQSRGYVDFRITSVNAELTRERDGYFITFNIQEGQQFRFGDITTTTDLQRVNADDYQDVVKMRPGVIYSPSHVDTTIARMERLAIRQGHNFVRVEPRITRNDRELTLDVEFMLTRGPRVFVERIDIEGNTTTLDRVIRRQFRVVEGDPFNPRQIRESAERIRALGFFEMAEVNAREGSRPDQVIVNVDVEEKPTGSLSFGGAYGTSGGFSLLLNFKEENFMGRGQRLNLSFSGADSDKVYALGFSEPAFLGRDLRFDLDVSYRETDNDFADYDTTVIRFQPGISFPISDNSRLSLYYKAESVDIFDYTSGGAIIAAEAATGEQISSAVGYSLSYDTRRTGLNPNAGVLLEFGQEFAGLGGDTTYLRSSGKVVAQTRVWNEEVTLRASLEGGAINYTSGNSRVTDRYLIGGSKMRGFEPDGIGPREVVGSTDDALGGNAYAVASFEAEFPLGLPSEYGITGGVFYDVGSAWDLDATNSNVLYEDFSLRHVAGVSVFWKTPVGPLRFNFSNALQKEAKDREQTFDLTISTRF
ncbi:outer membrane protein assembly factor BamA [Sediminimonas qiaohouensis]|uniref:outer membrane protein assembly factor BamA n=1 Tax=Sediminimonas qiaohouensis TaxID=552061 RepID=UPI0003F65F6B|nr:outer membrane protein assembly factor BamA [Sediminimonas qiaohouensis]